MANPKMPIKDFICNFAAWYDEWCARKGKTDPLFADNLQINYDLVDFKPIHAPMQADFVTEMTP